MGRLIFLCFISRSRDRCLPGLFLQLVPARARARASLRTTPDTDSPWPRAALLPRETAHVSRSSPPDARADLDPAAPASAPQVWVEGAEQRRPPASPAPAPPPPLTGLPPSDQVPSLRCAAPPPEPRLRPPPVLCRSAIPGQHDCAPPRPHRALPRHARARAPGLRRPLRAGIAHAAAAASSISPLIGHTVRPIRCRV